ncbi:MAG: sigma-70 family RNA polymerase sigma factor [Eubacteriales bacterium]|nr:sigma-70 family RNA polymerase sigma factor [Eubacteriales bacterium]
MDQYQNLIYSICLKSIGNPFDAEDLTQEVFLSAYKNLSRFDGAYEKAWLSKIAVRKCLDYLKSAGRRTIPTEDTYFTQIPDRSSSPEEALLTKDSNTQVRLLCERLKSPYREVAIAHFCEELSVTEIARRQNKNAKTIQTQLYRAKSMLKKMLAAPPQAALPANALKQIKLKEKRFIERSD